MSQMLVERGHQSGPHGSPGRGDAPAGAEQFIDRAMHVTGCSRSLAVSALRLIMRRHRPHPSHLRGYLAKFSAADLAHWIEQALGAERATLATLLIGDFAEQITVDRVLGSEADDQAGADRRRAAFIRAYPTASPRPMTGMQRLDAALAKMRRSSLQAAAAMDAVGGVPCAQG